MNEIIKITDQVQNYQLAQSYQMIEAKLNVSSLALNIFYFIAMQVDSKKDNDFFRYQISKVDLDKQLGLNTDYNALKRVAKELTSNSINIQSLDKKGFKYRPLFSVCDYEEGILTFEIHKDLKEHFINLKNNYISVDFLNNVVKIKNSYAKRMYFMLKQRSSLGTWEYELSFLREVLKTPKYMDRYKEFRIHVLDKTLEEVNKFTDLEVSYKEIKTKRSVTSVRFFIKSKSVKKEHKFKKYNKVNKQNKTNNAVTALEEFYFEND